YYTARDREQVINSYTSAITGENHTPWLKADWGASYADSRAHFPYDYEMDFTEPSILENGKIISHMLPVPDSLMHGPPESFIPYALNNFDAASLYTAYFRDEENSDIERTAFLDLSRDYTMGRRLSGTLKLGGKYRDRARERSRSELFSPYYNSAIPNYVDSAGTIVEKNYAGTRFEDLSVVGSSILFSNFLDDQPVNRALFGKYDLYPLTNRDALREWWDYNRKGYSDQAGTNAEYKANLEPDAEYYKIKERIYAAYAMNTLNFGQTVTLISGVRMEHEEDDYTSRFTPGTLSGFPVPTGVIRDTSAVHKETLWLPNFHLTVRPSQFMNVRLAAYEALARPDYNYRLPSVVKKARSTFFPGNNMYVGNPELKAARAWNFEVNTSFFSNKIGLFSVSAFYKDIKDMFQLIDGLPVTGQRELDSLGIHEQQPFGKSDDPIVLTFPYNSTHPTIVKGIEIEHQTDFRFLPGLLRNIVLSYNMSFVRSETFVPFDDDTTVYVKPLPMFPPVPVTTHRPAERKQKLQGQPEFFGNIALGYDIGGFSIRLSVFHQGQFNRTFSADGRSDGIMDAFTRWDLAVKQDLSPRISILLNVNNLSNTEEGNSTLNRLQGWHLVNERQIYGRSADLGVRITL
ncbi:TonB-dependent receptor, partial [bacterium]|nr:TonB-dependent receptor [bacterium]